MTLETFPAEDVDPVVANVHPCMLHLVRMGNIYIIFIYIMYTIYYIIYPR